MKKTLIVLNLFLLTLIAPSLAIESETQTQSISNVKPGVTRGTQTEEFGILEEKVDELKSNMHKAHLIKIECDSLREDISLFFKEKVDNNFFFKETNENYKKLMYFFQSVREIEKKYSLNAKKEIKEIEDYVKYTYSHPIEFKIKNPKLKEILTFLNEYNEFFRDLSFEKESKSLDKIRYYPKDNNEDNYEIVYYVPYDYDPHLFGGTRRFKF